MTDVGPRWPEGWSISQVGYGDPEVALLVEQVQAFYVERYGGPDETPLDPLMFQPPHGSFFLGHLHRLFLIKAQVVWFDHYWGDATGGTNFQRHSPLKVFRCASQLLTQ